MTGDDVPPLPPSVTLTASTPEQSRPQTRPVPLSDVDRVFAGVRVKGRKAADGTNWCISCDTTLSASDLAAFCNRHNSERNTEAQRRRRAQQQQARPVMVPAAEAERIIAATDALLVQIGRATTRFQQASRVPDWVDDLMLVAKDLTYAVDQGLRVRSPEHQPVSERERRRAAAEES